MRRLHRRLVALSLHAGVASLTAALFTVSAQPPLPQTQNPNSFKYFFPSGPLADDATDHYTPLNDLNIPCHLQAQDALDVVNKRGDRAIHVHLDRVFYEVVNANLAQSVFPPPLVGNTQASYMPD